MEGLQQAAALTASLGPRIRNPDIWFCIFEFLAEERRIADIMSIMLVNKAWNSIAAPLLFRYVFINVLLSPRRPERLLAELVRRHLKQDSPGGSTRELFVADSWSDPKRAGDLSPLLLHFPALRKFACHPLISYKELDPLFHTCGDSLQSLDVVLGGSEIGLSLGIIDGMKNLESLALGVCGLRKLSERSYDVLPGLHLPNVRSLRFHVDDVLPQNATRPLDYLCQCTFPAVVKLDLDVHLYSADDFASFTEHKLKSFFDAHGSRLTWLGIAMWNQPLPPWFASTLNGLNTIAFVAFFNGPQSQALMDSIPPSVRNIHIQLPELESDLPEEEAFYLNWLGDVMNSILEAASKKAIRSITLGGEEFRWSCIGDFHSFWCSEIMRWGLTMAKHGILLPDSDGVGIYLKDVPMEEVR